MTKDYKLKKEEKKELLQIARSTLEENAAKNTIPPVKPHNETLVKNAAAFVTLKTKDGRLRGCIGTFSADTPLFKTVQNMTLAAAFQDPRFPPVMEHETKDLVIEISVLSPLQEISADEVEIGVHGLFVTRGSLSGVLLPQVPVELGWNRSTFLQEVCLKAGLPPNAYTLPDTKLEAFTADVFTEEQ